MASISIVQMSAHLVSNQGSSGALLRTLVIELTSFFTVMDLFATRAILRPLSGLIRSPPPR